MKKLVIGLVVVAALAVVVAVALRIASRGEKQPVRGIEEIQAEDGVPVDAVTVRLDTLTVTREVSGEVEGWEQTNVAARADHKVKSIYVREGQRVSRGDRLLDYDVHTAPDLAARLQQSQASFDNAKRQVDRLEPLFEKGAVSESDLDNARTQLQVAEANLRDARLQVEERSPIDGVVTLVGVTPGQSVVTGQTVAQVAALDSVRVVAEVSSDAARDIAKGSRARANLDLGPGFAPGTDPLTSPDVTVGEGRIRRVALGADPASRLYEVEAVLANRNLVLRPGQFVTLSVATRRLNDALTVPRAALLGEQEVVPGSDQEVFAVVDGKAQRRSVRLGAIAEDRAQVTDGLQPGEVVVVFGANRLREGVKVRFHKLDGKLMTNPGSAVPASEETTR
jgi:RND family efflux transporter MFP subunit